MIVIGRPHSIYNYEFEIVKPLEEDIYIHCGYYEDGFKAFFEAERLGALVIHNVRITRRELK